MYRIQYEVPAELTVFVPEKLLVYGPRTWKLVEDVFTGGLEIRRSIFSWPLICQIAALVFFLSGILAIGLIMLAYGLQDFPKLALIALSCVACFTILAGILFFSGLFIYLSSQNASAWKESLRFRYDPHSREIFFSRENARYSPEDYRQLLIGTISGYNIRSLSQFRRNAKVAFRNRQYESPTRITELFILVQKTDGNWVRHLLAYDGKSKAIQQAAEKLQKALNCTTITRSMTARECFEAQMRGSNDEIDPEILKMAKPSGWIPYALGAPFFLLGLCLVCFGITDIYKGEFRSKYWPTCMGTVTHSEVVRNTSRNQNKTNTYYSARIDYEYSVDGQKYNGDRYSFGSSSYRDSKSFVQVTVDSHPIGSKIKVYYSPTNPNQSVLKPGVGLGTFVTPVLGAFVALWGVAIAFFVRLFFRKIDFMSHEAVRSETVYGYVQNRI